jgi:hypothetical protein
MLFPLAFFMILMTVQFALYMFSRHVAIAAAQEGARVARTEEATNGRWQQDASDKAVTWVTRLGPSLTMPNPPEADKAGIVDGVQNVSVTVTVSVPSILPFMGAFAVTEQSTGPIEQFVPDQ